MIWEGRQVQPGDKRGEESQKTERKRPYVRVARAVAPSPRKPVEQFVAKGTLKRLEKPASQVSYADFAAETNISDPDFLQTIPS